MMVRPAARQSPRGKWLGSLAARTLAEIHRGSRISDNHWCGEGESDVPAAMADRAQGRGGSTDNEPTAFITCACRPARHKDRLRRRMHKLIKNVSMEGPCSARPRNR